MPFCSMCGAKNEEGYRFCVKCGNAKSSPDLKPVADSGVLDSRQDDNRKKPIKTVDQKSISGIFANRFEIIRLIGRGGMGEVFLVHDEITNEEVALKIIREQYSSNPEVRARFIREVTLTRRIKHPNVISVFDVGRDQDRLYYTMEFLDGSSLRDHINYYKKEKKTIPVNQLGAILKQICAGLETAHKLTVHRDLKPENVMISNKEEVKILDFGLAKALDYDGETRHEQKLGTAYYMAPEQMRGSQIEIDARADIYSLGVMLYELLTLDIPLPGSDPILEIRRDLPAEIEEVYRKSIAYDRDKRYQNVTSFSLAVVELLSNKQEEDTKRMAEEKRKPEEDQNRAIEKNIRKFEIQKMVSILIWRKHIQFSKGNAHKFEVAGNYKQALDAWMTIRTQIPSDTEVIKAIQDLENRIELEEEKKRKVKIENLLHQCEERLNNNQWEECRELIKSVIELDPGNAEVSKFIEEFEKKIKLIDSALSTELKREIFADRFEIIRSIGRGEKCEVFLVTDQMTHKKVALKIVNKDDPSNPDNLTQFKIEATLTRKIEHPNVIRIFEADIFDSRFYYTMEFFDGRSLRDIINDHKNSQKMIPVERILYIFKQICSGLQATHKFIAHMNLQPEKIMVSGKDVVKIQAFCLARAFQHDAFDTAISDLNLNFKNCYYIPPEQMTESSVEIDDRADIYSLGILLYELLTLEMPMPGSDAISEIRPEVSKKTDEVYRKCIASDPKKRYQDVQSLEKSLIEAMMDQQLVKVTRDESEPRVVVPEKPKIEAITSKIGLEMVKIPAGTFMMGSPENEQGRHSNETLHQVTISKSYWMSRYPITQKIYQEVMGNNLSRYKGSDVPVYAVSWYDAVKFCNEISKKEGYDLAYSIAEKTRGIFKKERMMEANWNNPANGYRLPTEAEWEYACRSGTKFAFYTGNCTEPEGMDPAMDRAGWYLANSNNTLYPVGKKEPNSWGLYDMHGSVWEWCWDCSGFCSTGRVKDPTGENSGPNRISRGGSKWYFAGDCRSARREEREASSQQYDQGFRVVRTCLP